MKIWVELGGRASDGLRMSRLTCRRGDKQAKSRSLKLAVLEPPQAVCQADNLLSEVEMGVGRRSASLSES